MNPSVLRTFYSRTNNAKNKFDGLSPEDHHILTEFEIHLWRINDLRTNWATTVSFLKVDNSATKINMPVWYIHTKVDNYFDINKVQQNMSQIFNACHSI